MTPQEMMDQVISVLERPDLASLAVTRFPQALRSAHSVEYTRRDLTNKTWLISSLAVLDGKVGVTIPARMRKIHRLYTRDAAGVLVEEFQDLQNKAELTSYFGFKILQTYNIFGINLNVAGISASAYQLRIEYFQFPTWTQEAGVWTTNSWIADSHPELIMAYLQHQLALITEDANQINSAEKQIQMCRRDFIASIVEDIV